MAFIPGGILPLVWVEFSGQSPSLVQLRSQVSVPGLFTAIGQGTGPVAALNEDGSYNGSAKPARKGSIVVVYMTGEGQTNPPGVTGAVTVVSQSEPLTPQPALPVQVTIDGQPATLTFLGEAPGMVSGVMQLNVQIPSTARTGLLPILVTVGQNRSQSGVTISVL
jgi:uncharacterized protein (TIGR03437 family)